jgi:hypothetical protein
MRESNDGNCLGWMCAPVDSAAGGATADALLEERTLPYEEDAVERLLRRWLGVRSCYEAGLASRPPCTQRCHQRCAAAGDTLKAATAAFSVRPSIARTRASRPASPSLALACRYIRALL